MVQLVRDEITTWYTRRLRAADDLPFANLYISHRPQHSRTQHPKQHRYHRPVHRHFHLPVRTEPQPLYQRLHSHPPPTHPRYPDYRHHHPVHRPAQMDPFPFDQRANGRPPPRRSPDPQRLQRNHSPHAPLQRPEQHNPHHPTHRPPTNSPCIHIYSYGQTHSELPTLPHPIIAHIQCRKLCPPPLALCQKHTGLSPTPSAAFFSDPDNLAAYRKNIDGLLMQLREEKRVGCLAVVVSCGLGRHRSVAMAEKMAKRLAREGWKVMIGHLRLLGEEGGEGRKGLGREGRKEVRFEDEA